MGKLLRGYKTLELRMCDGVINAYVLGRRTFISSQKKTDIFYQKYNQINRILFDNLSFTL